MSDQTLFMDDIDRRKLLEILDNAVRRYNLILHAFTLLDDGYKLLFETPRANMVKAMQYINSHYTAYVNTRRRQASQVFKGRYLSTIIEKPRYLLKLCRYIHLLPVSKGLAKHPDLYPWSSHSKYVLPNDQPPLIYTKDILSNYGGNPRRRRKRYQQYIEAAASTDLAPITLLLKKTRVLGAAGFAEKVSKADSIPAPITIPPEVIINKTAEYYSVSTDSITDNKTKPNPPRNAAIFLCRNMTDTPLEKLGEIFDVGPSSVCNTAKRVEAHRKSDDTLQKTLQQIEHFIRRNSYSVTQEPAAQEPAPAES